MSPMSGSAHSVRIAGAESQADSLLPVVYEELRRIAMAKMASEPPGHTLQATALVHEAWLRLGGSNQPAWNSRAHFFAAASEAMRRILVERARARRAKRRGGGALHVELDSIEIAAPSDSEDLVEISDALDRFACEHPAKAELVKLRFFAGLALKEAAVLMDISEPTAKRWWAYSRAWLFDDVSRARGTAFQTAG